MDTPSSKKTSGIPAPYGQACTTCARAKARCIYRIDGHDCDRCYRLGKECTQSASTRRRVSKREAVPRSANLGEKMTDKSASFGSQSPGNPPSRTFLNSLGVNTPAQSKDSQVSQSVSGRPPAAGLEYDVSNYDGYSLVISALATSGENIFQTSLPFDKPSVLSSPFEPTLAQAEEYLLIFRKRMLVFFPIVYLPPQTTARQLREWSPFLWFSIMAITARPGLDEFAMTESIKQFIAQEMVVNNQKNLDLLLGLLVFICWFHYHRNNKSYIAVMTSLALSLVCDMNLSKGHIKLDTVPCSQDKRKLMASTVEKTMAERRAVLACFLITSQLAYIKKSIDALEWTSHLDKCLDVVSQCPEWPGDEQLATQVKIQLIYDQMSRGTWKRPEHPPPVTYLEALGAQVNRIKAQIPPTLEHNESITSELLYTELVLQDVMIGKTPSSSHNPSLQRHQLLEAHWTTIIQWLDLFFALPPDQYVGITFARWGHVAHTLTLLHRLYILDDPAWDAAAVQSRVDVLALCDRVAAVLEETGARRRSVGAPRCENSAFVKLASIVKAMRSSWGSDVQPEGRGEGAAIYQALHNHWLGSNHEVDVGLAAGPPRGMAVTTAAPQQLMCMPDDAWLNEIFNVTW